MTGGSTVSGTFTTMRVLLAVMLLGSGCSHKTGREHVRGRLGCVQHTVPEWRNYGANVTWEVFLDGRELELSRRTSSCFESPNPAVEALVLFRDAVRVEAGKAVFTPLQGNPEFALWGCDGRCLIYQGGANVPAGLEYVDTGVFEPLQKLPGQPLSLSPARSMLVTSLPASESTLEFCLLDLANKSASRWTVPRKTVPWLERCPESIGLEDFGDCLQRRGAKFQWARDEAGRDVLVPPSAEATSAPARWDHCES